MDFTHVWFESKTYYKKLILEKLPTDIIEKFLLLLHSNTKAAEWLFQSKAFELVSLGKDTINNLTLRDVRLFSSIGESIENIMKIFQSGARISNLTVHNVGSLLWFIDNKTQISGNVDFRARWGPGNCENASKNIETHYLKHVLSEDEVWDLKTIEEYEAFPLDHFHSLERKIIHTNGKVCFLSGFYGKYFTIGRLEKGEFTISSCYYVEKGEKPGRLNGKLIDF